MGKQSNSCGFLVECSEGWGPEENCPWRNGTPISECRIHKFAVYLNNATVEKVMRLMDDAINHYPHGKIRMKDIKTLIVPTPKNDKKQHTKQEQ